MALLVCSSGAVFNLVKASQKAHTLLTGKALVLWWLLGLVSYAWAWVGGWCWVQGLLARSRHWSPTVAWLAFAALALAFSGSAGLLRSVLAGWFLPDTITPLLARNFALSQALVCLVSFWGSEWLGHQREGHRQRLALKSKLLAHLEEEQSTWVRTDDRQRRQVAEWLHGRVQSLLWGAWAEWRQAQKAPKDQAARHLAAVRTKLALVAQDSQQPLLAPVHAGDLAQLPQRLSVLAEGFQGPLAVAVQLAPGWAQLAHRACDGEALAAALLVVEEALLNACKHGRSRRAWLDVGPAPSGGLQLAIRSEGPAGPSPLWAEGKGLGLGVMLPHLEGLGGHGHWQQDAEGRVGWVLVLPLLPEARP